MAPFLRLSLWIAVRLMLAVGLLSAPAHAASGQVPLRYALEVSRTADGDWTWLALADTRGLASMPSGWTLHVDQVRFRQIAVVAKLADGRELRIVRRAGQLGGNWAPGGALAFSIAAPGRDIANLRIGLQGIDDVNLLRKVTALTPAEADRTDDGWLLVMGVFCGLLISAFVYNLFVYAGQRYPFQRWYLGWVAAALTYGLLWTNMAGFLFPALVGPWAVRIDAALVGVVVALGSYFLVSVLEEDKVPALMRRVVQAASVCCVGAALVAADDWHLDAAFTDRVFNIAMLVSVCASVTTVLVAVARGSRVVWLYLIGWTPVIAVYACRAARNFGFAGQSDTVDMATFAAIGFESLVFSLVIADRFIALRRQRDAAEASARGMEIERETLRRAAHADFLTGLGNRAFFHDRLRELLQDGEPFSLFLIDVDYLKELNDRQGHDAGDALLKHIGVALGAFENERTSCARIGGDEFAVLLAGTAEEAAKFAKGLSELQGMLWSRFDWSGVLSMSIGCAAGEPSLSASDLYQRADIALYEAKKQGRGRFQMFDSRLQQQIHSRLQLIREARDGIARGEFVLHFQPIVAVSSSQLVSVEALLRWKHPVRGVMTPAEFDVLMTDEEIGPALQDHVVTLAIEELRRRRSFRGTVAVNFTAMDLSGREAAQRLLGKLAAAGVKPSSLCVEVTEGTILARRGVGPGEALRVLHQAGVRIALDDFGTGYASLVHLKEIPVDVLKIDRSFVAGLMRRGDESEEIVRAVLALGRGLNKTVIAEGVESLAQLLRLKELGCDQAQGYLFGRPSPAFPRDGDALAAA